MSFKSRKRKQRAQQSDYSTYDSDVQHRDDTNVDPLAALFIQAYEADLTRGPEAEAAAESLEVVLDESDDPMAPARMPKKVGKALIAWGGSDAKAVGFSKTTGVTIRDDDHDFSSQSMHDPAEDVLWVDRYDTRLLLDSLPPLPVETALDPGSPSGWSDLPSDSEDVFFFTPDEAENFRREKRRRLIDQNREDRMKAILASTGESADEEEAWGGSDEEPDETQKGFMDRTAKHIVSSPNPAQLEMRILANHGADKRFAFLRGRWKKAWRLAQAKARIEKEMEEQLNKADKGLGGLADYGDSDEDADNESTPAGEGDPSARKSMNHVENEKVQDTGAEAKSDDNNASSNSADEAVKEARRARAKEWAEKRRNPKS